MLLGIWSRKIPQFATPRNRSSRRSRPFAGSVAKIFIVKNTEVLEEILLHHFPDVASPAMQDGASRIKCHPDRRLYLHEWRHDELHRVDVHMQKCGPWLRQPVLHSSFELI